MRYKRRGGSPQEPVRRSFVNSIDNITSNATDRHPLPQKHQVYIRLSFVMHVTYPILMLLSLAVSFSAQNPGAPPTDISPALLSRDLVRPNRKGSGILDAGKQSAVSSKLRAESLQKIDLGVSFVGNFLLMFRQAPTPRSPGVCIDTPHGIQCWRYRRAQWGRCFFHTPLASLRVALAIVFLNAFAISFRVWFVFFPGREWFLEQYWRVEYGFMGVLVVVTAWVEHKMPRSASHSRDG